MKFQEKYLKITDRFKDLQGKQKILKAELQIAYDYKEDVIAKAKLADKQIEEKQSEYFRLLSTMQTEIARLKIAMDLEVEQLNTI